MTDFFKLPQPNLTPGKVVRAFRKNFGFTLQDIDKLTGAGETNLSAIENDNRVLGPELATRLAAVFGINPALILFPNGPEALDKPEFKKIHASAVALRQKKYGT
jgi:transcriptional regulator with XRE-family HTH domain